MEKQEMEDRFLIGKDTSSSNWKSIQRKMLSKKLLFILFLIPSTISFFRLFKITLNSSTSSSLPPTIPNSCSQTTPRTPQLSNKLTLYATSLEEDDLTTKEHQLLSNIISQRTPCNLLFFGFRPQFHSLAALNNKGNTVFLEDNEDKLKQLTPKTKGVRSYKVKYKGRASEAFELLKHAREYFGCKPANIQLLQDTGCRLAVNELPQEVYDRKWDVVVVDGPRGDHPEAPGRMGAIYTAAVIARAGNTTDVFIHDANRMIEKWYSWEFLCQENLAASKGKLWYFSVKGTAKYASFCPDAKL